MKFTTLENACEQLRNIPRDDLQDEFFGPLADAIEENLPPVCLDNATIVGNPGTRNINIRHVNVANANEIYLWLNKQRDLSHKENG